MDRMENIDLNTEIDRLITEINRKKEILLFERLNQRGITMDNIKDYTIVNEYRDIPDGFRDDYYFQDNREFIIGFTTQFKLSLDSGYKVECKVHLPTV